MDKETLLAFRQARAYQQAWMKYGTSRIYHLDETMQSVEVDKTESIRLQSLSVIAHLSIKLPELPGFEELITGFNEVYQSQLSWYVDKHLELYPNDTEYIRALYSGSSSQESMDI